MDRYYLEKEDITVDAEIWIKHSSRAQKSRPSPLKIASDLLERGWGIVIKHPKYIWMAKEGNSDDVVKDLHYAKAKTWFTSVNIDEN